MKKNLIVTAMVAASLLLSGCDDAPKTKEQVAHEQKMEEMRLKMQHEERMARIQAGEGSGTMTTPVQPIIVNTPDHSYQPEQPYYEQPDQYNTNYGQSQPVSTTAPASQYDRPQYDSGVVPDNQSDSGSSVMSTVGAVAAGALVGYAASELLDNGMRSYTSSDGRTVYVGKDGKEISKSAYEDYRRKNPLKSKVSDANLKSKQMINKGAAKTAEVTKKGYEHGKQATQKAATATKSAASKASQHVRSTTTKATNSFKSSSFRSGRSRRK